jgi:5-methylcytosine-specific restriction endonuclease McrA
MAVQSYDALLLSLLNRLVMQGDDISHELAAHRHHAVSAAADLLGVTAESVAYVEHATRLRLAMSLAPRAAIDHRSTDRTSRRDKVFAHLQNTLGLGEQESEILASVITRTLESWLTPREHVNRFKEALRRRDGNYCRACGLNFSRLEDNRSVQLKDEFKRHWSHLDRFGRSTVDHKQPVSKFGTNDLSNLQLLCFWCNQGKADESPPLLKHELHHCGLFPRADDTGALTPQELAHLSKLFYWTLKRSSFACAQCSSVASEEVELTIRLVSSHGLFVLSNLTARCFGCVDNEF